MIQAAISERRSEFSCFVGKWSGTSKTFDLDGRFLEESNVYIEVFWEDENSLFQVEHIANLYQVGEVKLHSQLKISGKTASAHTEHLKLNATALTARNFIFRVESGASKTTLHNAHYFLDDDNRTVITHKFKDGHTFVFQVQEFTRVK